jgi:hypothetical protein
MRRDVDLQEDQDAQPTSNLPSPAAQPVTPGVSRPPMPPPKDPLYRTIRQGLAMKIARFFGFNDYTADVAERIIGVYIVGDLSKQVEQEETRTGADYRVFQVDLSVAHNRDPILGTQDLIMTNVALIFLTAGGTLQLHIGDRDPLDFGGAGLGVGGGYECDPPEQLRLLVTNAAQPATIAKFIVSTGVRVSF